MNIPGGIEAIQEATRACYEHWQEYRRTRGQEPPEWTELGQRTQAQWTAAVMASLEVGIIALVHDYIAWAREQGDLSGGLAHAMRKYVSEELDYERAPAHQPEDEGKEEGTDGS